MRDIAITDRVIMCQSVENLLQILIPTQAPDCLTGTLFNPLQKLCRVCKRVRFVHQLDCILLYVNVCGSLLKNVWLGSISETFKRRSVVTLTERNILSIWVFDLSFWMQWMMGNENFPSDRSSQKPLLSLYCIQKCGQAISHSTQGKHITRGGHTFSERKLRKSSRIWKCTPNILTRSM
jgi:hypothetical protein